MPTYAELAAEQWWGREVVTPELTWLGTELCRRTGRPRDAAGSKGDNRHLRGSHRSQEWIKHSRYCTNRSYTVQSGLTSAQLRHVAGFDFNPGTTARMVAQSKRIIAAMRAGQLDEVLEFYGTVDGKKVTGWNNRENRYATSDSSHLWHWHISIDRRHCDSRALMERILRIALGDTTATTGEDDDMLTDLQDARLNAATERARSAISMEEIAWVDPRDGSTKREPNRLAASLLRLEAGMAALAGRDWVNEQAIVDGVLAGLGSRSLDEMESVLRAALGDERATELGERLAGLAGTGSA